MNFQSVILMGCAMADPVPRLNAYPGQVAFRSDTLLSGNGWSADRAKQISVVHSTPAIYLEPSHQ
jgi:hypothetical protein